MIDLEGRIDAGQTASVKVVVDDQFDNIDQQLLAEAIAEAVDSYDGPGELTFNDGSTLSFTSSDGTTMDPLAVTLPVQSDEATPDDMINLEGSENSEINEDDTSESQTDSNTDGEPEQNLISHKSEVKSPIVKRLSNWFFQSNESVS